MIEVHKRSLVYMMRITLEQIGTERTRCNKYKLAKNQAKYDLRKFYFSNRVVDICNSPPDSVVYVGLQSLLGEEGCH